MEMIEVVFGCLSGIGVVGMLVSLLCILLYRKSRGEVSLIQLSVGFVEVIDGDMCLCSANSKIFIAVHSAYCAAQFCN